MEIEKLIEDASNPGTEITVDGGSLAGFGNDMLRR
jgi:hypothetical protein